MSTLRKSLSNAGYDHEGAYFFQRDQQLIQKARVRRNLELIQGGGVGQTKADTHASPRGRKAA